MATPHEPTEEVGQVDLDVVFPHRPFTLHRFARPAVCFAGCSLSSVDTWTGIVAMVFCIRRLYLEGLADYNCETDDPKAVYLNLELQRPLDARVVDWWWDTFGDVRRGNWYFIYFGMERICAEQPFPTEVLDA